MRYPAPRVGLTPRALADIYAHALLEYPSECCGIVFGPLDSATADSVRRCTNVQAALHAQDPVRHPRSARYAYQFGGADLLLLRKSFASAHPAKIIYHSHVDAKARFSGGDQRAAAAGSEPAYAVDHLVVEVRSGLVRGAVQYGWQRRRRTFVEVLRYGSNGISICRID